MRYFDTFTLQRDQVSMKYIFRPIFNYIIFEFGVCPEKSTKLCGAYTVIELLCFASEAGHQISE